RPADQGADPSPSDPGGRLRQRHGRLRPPQGGLRPRRLRDHLRLPQQARPRSRRSPGRRRRRAHPGRHKITRLFCAIGVRIPAMIKGKATAEGTATYAKNHPKAHPQHWKNALGLTLSSLGMGSYLGNADPITDGKYAAALVKVLENGINVVDSAINYRYQRSERNLGVGLKKAIDSGAVARDQVLLCTKGGFIAGDMGPPTKEWFEETFHKPGLATPQDFVAGCHCMTPKYLR